MPKYILPSAILILILLLSGCGGKHIGIGDNRPLTLSEHSSSSLYEYVEDNVSSHAPQSGFYPLENHLDSLVMRVMLARAAKHCITVQYFTFHGDASGTILMKALIDAGKRGVKVDILLDDMDITYDDDIFGLVNSQPNIKIRVFNPTNSRRALHYVEMGLYNSTVGRRMHNKAFVVDNSMAVMGGRNIGDTYFGLDEDSFFIDNDVLVVGSLVNQISNQFDYYFSNAYSVDFDIIAKGNVDEVDDLKASYSVLLKDKAYLSLKRAVEARKIYKLFREKKLPLFYGNAELFYDMPNKISTDINDTATHLKSKTPTSIYAKKRFHMVSPYFIPSEKMMKRIKNMRDKGVEVSVLTNSLESSDQTTVYAFYALSQKRLLSMGVHLYEVHPRAFEKEVFEQSYNDLKETPTASLHAKTVVIDDDIFAIGSVNMDPRSRNLNTELIALIQSKELNAHEEKVFETMIAPENAYELSLEYDENDKARVVWKAVLDGKARTFYNDGDASLWLRMKKNMSRWFPIRDLL